MKLNNIKMQLKINQEAKILLISIYVLRLTIS